MTRKDDSDLSEYRLLKLKLRARMRTAESALPKAKAEFDAALRAEGVSMSRAERRRLLREILSEILDEVET